MSQGGVLGGSVSRGGGGWCVPGVFAPVHAGIHPLPLRHMVNERPVASYWNAFLSRKVFSVGNPPPPVNRQTGVKSITFP